MNKILINFFYISVLVLIIISIWPASLLGYLFYDNWSQQPDLISNPFGTTINHFISYLFISLLGFFIYKKTNNFQKVFYGLIFLSVMLETIHLIIPNRSFQKEDLIANILGVIVAYLAIKFYLLFKYYE